MGTHLLTVGLASLPALGIVVGALAAERLKLSRTALGMALHFAEGAMLAVVGVELMPRALGVEPPWVVVAAFLLGGGTFLLLEKAIEAAHRRRSRRGGDAGPWTIYAGAALDYVADGISIGTGVTIASELGLVLALGQVVANAPLAFVVIAALRPQTSPLGRGVLTLVFVVALLASALLSYTLFRHLPDEVRLALLAFSSGLLVLVIVEEITPRADRQGGARHGALSVLAGFSLFALVALYLG